ncbi:unnamed protein product, partial [Ectocarpus sp. 12 AP-2014]
GGEARGGVGVGVRSLRGKARPRSYLRGLVSSGDGVLGRGPDPAARVPSDGRRHMGGGRPKGRKRGLLEACSAAADGVVGARSPDRGRRYASVPCDENSSSSSSSSSSSCSRAGRGGGGRRYS